MKTIIERGASWTLEETKLLLALWGQDLVHRKESNMKRTKEVYEKIAEKFNQSGFERTADQVRTRVFNMIAEYRRILKDPNPERMKKCIFFEALDKIYHAKGMDDVKSALDDYEPEYPYSPASDKADDLNSDSEATEGNATISASDAIKDDGDNNNSVNNIGHKINEKDRGSNNSVNNLNHKMNEKNSDNNNSVNNLSDKMHDKNGDNNHANEKDSSHTTHSKSSDSRKRIKLESSKSSKSHNSASTSTEHSLGASSSPQIAGAAIGQSLLKPQASSSTPTAKLTNATPSYISINSTKLPIIRTNQLIGASNDTVNAAQARLPTGHQLYQAPVNTFDVTSSALLIDRVFAHLTRESENMREWIALEKERIAIERTRRQQEAEREVRREKVLVETLMRFQDQWLSYLSRLDPRILENASEPLPELRIPKVGADKDNSELKTEQESQGSQTQQSQQQHSSQAQSHQQDARQ